SRAASSAAPTSVATSRASRRCSRTAASTPSPSSAAASACIRPTPRWPPRSIARSSPASCSRAVLPYDGMTMSTAPTDAVPTTPPVPDLTPEELIARAVAMRPELVERQADAEQRSYYSEEMHQKFVDAGFYRTYVPRKYGGFGFDPKTMTRLQLELARGDM